MKKILLLIIMGITFSYTAFSQCTPITFPGPAVTIPDTTQGLPPVVATVPYSEVIHLRIPADTLIPPLTVPIAIDSVGIIGIQGMPPGFTYVTNSPSDFWPGGSYGCTVLQGTAAESDTGSYRVEIQVQVVMAGNPLSFSYFYDMVVLDSINAGFSHTDFAKFTVHQNVPNPFDDKTIIKFNTLRSSVFTFEVYDVVGNLVRQQQIFALKGVNKIIFSKGNLSSGVFFFRLSDKDNSIVKRMVVR